MSNKSSKLKDMELEISVDRIEVDIRPILSLFFREELKKAKTIKRRWEKDPSKRGGGYFRNQLVGSDEVATQTKTLETRTKKILESILKPFFYKGNHIFETTLFPEMSHSNPNEKQGKLEFLKEIYEKVYSEYVEDVKPSTPSASEKIEFGNDVEIYTNFENDPDLAAHFLLQRHLETSNTNMVCKNVMRVNFEGKPVPVDFIIGFYDPINNKGHHGIYKMSYKHIDDFNSYKRFIDDENLKGANIRDKLYDLSRNEVANAREEGVGFDYVVKKIQETCKHNKPKNQDGEIVFRDDTTGWKCVFARKDFCNRLTLTTFYNTFIDDDIKGEVDPILKDLLMKSKNEKSIEEYRVTFDDFLKKARSGSVQRKKK